MELCGVIRRYFRNTFSFCPMFTSLGMQIPNLGLEPVSRASWYLNNVAVLNASRPPDHIRGAK